MRSQNHTPTGIDDDGLYQRGRIYVQRSDRLGMRLTFLVPTWRFARKINYQTVVMWPSHEENSEKDLSRDSSYPLSDFFDVDATMRSVGDNSLCFEESNLPKNCLFVDKDPRLEGLFPGKFIRAKVHNLPKEIYVKTNAAGLKFRNEGPDLVRRECADLFKLLVPSKEVLDALRLLQSATGNRRLIGVHIRRGDLFTTLRHLIETAASGALENIPTGLPQYIKMTLFKAAPLLSYRELIKRSQESADSILLFTDSPELAESIKSEIGAKIPFIFVHQVETPSANSNQRSFAELLLMMQCDVLIGTRSAFSRAAELFGQMPFHDASKFLSKEKHIEALFEECAGDILIQNPKLADICNSLAKDVLKSYFSPKPRRPI